MFVENQLIDIKYNTKIAKHYRNLGYEFNPKSTIEVPVEHLTNGSHAQVKIICDECGIEFSRPYYRAIQCRTELFGDLCRQCCTKQRVFTCRNKYGFDSVMQVPEFIRKKENTFLEKYGETCPLKVKEIREKGTQTMLEKYGKENYSQTEEWLKKIIATNRERRGCDYPSQSKDVQSKIRKSFESRHDLCWTSKQQLKIFDMIKEIFPNDDATINQAFENFSLDIVLNVENVKIDIEYDGWHWHKDRQKYDRMRDEILKRNGYKILRIKSGTQVPDVYELKNKIYDLINTDAWYLSIKLDDWE